MKCPWTVKLLWCPLTAQHGIMLVSSEHSPLSVDADTAAALSLSRSARLETRLARTGTALLWPLNPAAWQGADSVFCDSAIFNAAGLELAKPMNPAQNETHYSVFR
jgi:hypothetical protein